MNNAHKDMVLSFARSEPDYQRNRKAYDTLIELLDFVDDAQTRKRIQIQILKLDYRKLDILKTAVQKTIAATNRNKDMIEFLKTLT